MNNYWDRRRRFGSLRLLLPALGILLGLFACSDPDPPEQLTATPSNAEPSAAELDVAEPGGAAKGPRRPGHWRKLRVPGDEPAVDADQRKMISKLQSLGYVAGSRDPETDQVVTVHDRDKVWTGWNFFVSAHAPEAILMDMQGSVLHRWNCPIQRALPNFPIETLHPNGRDFWRRAYLFENGDVLAIFEGAGLLKLDKESNLIWAKPNYAHHDLQVMPNGDIYVLTRKIHLVPRVHPTTPVYEDFITVLDANGNEQRRVSVLTCLEKVLAKRDWDMPWLDHGDILHTNSLQVLDGRAADLAPAFKSGNVVVSLRFINLIGVVDMDEAKFSWFLASGRPVPPNDDGSPNLFFKLQHDPKFLANGHMLLFDNNGLGKQSTVWEFEPLNKGVFWRFHGTEQQPLYTEICGTAERLANGNTLITESDNGRVIEVTREKEIVWEFYNPHRAGQYGQYIAMVPELIRLPPTFPVDWAQSRAEP